MTHEVSLPRMTTLSMHDGTIGVEDNGDGLSEIVVRIPMSHKEASDVYYELGNIGVRTHDR